MTKRKVRQRAKIGDVFHWLVLLVSNESRLIASPLTEFQAEAKDVLPPPPLKFKFAIRLNCLDDKIAPSRFTTPSASTMPASFRVLPKNDLKKYEVSAA